VVPGRAGITGASSLCSLFTSSTLKKYIPKILKLKPFGTSTDLYCFFSGIRGRAAYLCIKKMKHTEVVLQREPTGRTHTGSYNA
jgi:hypothetical protein